MICSCSSSGNFRRRAKQSAAPPLVIAFLCLLAAGTADALPITFDFAGSVTLIVDANNLLDGLGISTGSSTFSGSFKYEPAALPIRTFPNGANYHGGDLSAVVDGTFNYSHPGPQVSQVLNDHLILDDFFSNSASSGFAPFTQFGTPVGTQINTMQLSFLDNSATAFSNVSLPSSLLLSDFNDPRFSVAASNRDGTFYRITGRVTSLSLAVTAPEPATFFLLLLAFVGIRLSRTA